ncbi:MAG TPA: EAL domain-containing protein [Gammaproteobacteria bacterium]|nr:EAL domain-containing protein [Gammaproteobacteria bacterium]
MNRYTTFKGKGLSPLGRQTLLFKLLLAGGIILSLLVFQLARKAEYDAAQADFRFLAEAHDSTLQKEIWLNLDLVENINSFYQSSRYVSREEFRDFTARPLAFHDAVRYVAWLPRVSARDRVPFEQRLGGSDGAAIWEFDPGGAVRPAGEREEYFPVEYLRPRMDHAMMVGLDLSTVPIYREAMAEARQRGTMVVSKRIELEKEKGYGVAVFRPVYRQTQGGTSQDLAGFLMAVVDISTLLGEAVVSWGIFQMDIVLLDESASGEDRLLFNYTAGKEEPASTSAFLQSAEAMYWRSEMDVPGRKWTLVFRPGKGFLASHQGWEPWIALLTGLILTLVLCALQWGAIRRTREMELLADGLYEANEELGKEVRKRQQIEEAVKRSRKMLRLVLDTIPVRVFWKDRELRYLGCNRNFARDAGMDSPREIVGKDDFQLAWREQAERYRSDDRQVIESGQARFNFEEPQTTPDGRRLWLRTSKIPLTDMDGSIIGVLGTYEDITEQKEAEQALKRETAEKERIERALVEVANAVSSSTGTEFFRILVQNLHRTLQVDIAFIAAVSKDDPEKMETLALCVDGEILDNVILDLPGSPCEKTMCEGGYFQPRGVARSFAMASLLSQLGVESYLGTPLHDMEGNVLGTVGVMCRQPMESRQPAESILQIFANRTSAELQHQRAEAEIQDLIRFPNENPSPVLRVQEDGTLLYANRGSSQLLEAWGCSVRDRVPEEVQGWCRAALEDGGALEVDLAYGECEYSFLFAPSVENRYVSIFAHDITERQRTRAEMSKLSRAVEQTADSIFITNAEGVIEYVNPAFEATTGYHRSEVLGRTPRLFKSGRHDQAFYERMWQTILSGEVYRDIIINRRKDGTLYYEEKSITPLVDDSGRISHFISTGKDITQRMQVEERLHHLAYHDVLTDLPNRAMFMDRLSHALERRHEDDRKVAVMFLDLDRFKNINDTLGHDSGDRLLQMFSRMLQGCVREGDTVARFGGDEFAVLLEDVPSMEAAATVADKVREALAVPFRVDGPDLYVTTSIGISMFPDDGDDAVTLLKHADSAMYRAKEMGRNNYQFYAADMSTLAMERLTLEHGLRHALERGEFQLVYQPQVDINSGRIVGAEALLRWHSPDEPVGPDRFIPVLEETGMILEVGEWVLREACMAIGRWNEQLDYPLRIAVNVSGRQFHDPDFSLVVARLLEETGIPPSVLELEITESVLMQNDRSSQENLEALRRLGVHLAIDDFGTGYSSLSYLKRFPVDSLKIDRSFVRDITSDTDDATIVNAITAMAHRLNLTVIAEGVEDEEQLEYLRQCACDVLQGYLFSKPVPEEEMVALLRASRRKVQGQS